MEERGFEQSLFVFICVHLWLRRIVSAPRAGPAFQPGAFDTAGVVRPSLGMIRTPAQLWAGEPAPQKAGA
jgi:hypothetical protein